MRVVGDRHFEFGAIARLDHRGCAIDAFDVHTALETVAGIGATAVHDFQAAHRTARAPGIETGGLQQDIDGLFGDLGAFSTQNAGDRAPKPGNRGE